MPIPASALAPNRQKLLTFVSPNVADILFMEVVDAQRVRNGIPEYGTPHPDTDRWPDHELVLVKAADDQGLFYQYYYAAKREAQDDYNFEFDQGSQLIRTYIIPRDEYFARNAVEAAAADPAVTNEFLVPVVTTPDARFPKFGFADDTLTRTETELDSTYVVVRRRYLEPVSYEVIRDEELDSDVLIERRIIAKDAADLPVSEAGVTVERKDVNVFHDLLTITRIGNISWSEGVPTVTPPTYPRRLTSVPSDASYPFPLLLRSASIEAVWAFADSAEAAFAYDEAWYFAYDLVEPAPGPYETRINRFLATDPNELATNYTVETPPATQRETIGIARWWAAASNKGNSAFAEAREEVIPSSIHDAIEIDTNGLKALSAGLSRTSLPATPGYAQFAAKRSMVVGYEPRKTRYGLYEVRVIELNCTGVYGGSKIPLGSVEGDGGNTGAGVVTGASRPAAPTAFIDAENTIVSGTTYPDSQITITDSSAAIVGRALSDSSGQYSAPLTATYLSAVTLSVSVRYNSATSFPVTVTTNDLTPRTPTGSLNAAGTTLNGVARAGSTVNINYSVTKQVVAVEVVGTVSGDGDLSVEVISDLTGTVTLTVPVLTGQSAATVAGLIVAAAVANTSVNANYVASAVGAVVFLTARVPAADDETLACNIVGDLGISPAFSNPAAPEVVSVATTRTANATTGAYSLTFSPALEVGSSVVVYATDVAGTSPSLTLTVNAAPPTLTGATFADSTSITGAATAGSVVRAYLNGNSIGSATTNGSGNFDITVPSLIRGEVVTVIAELASDATVKSASRTATAPDLDLEEPTIQYSDSLGFYGVMPSGATELVHWQTGYPAGTTASRVVGFSAERSILLEAVSAGYPSPPIGLVAIRDLPAATDPTCTVSGGLIVIHLASGSVSTATVAHIVALINATPAAAALVTATLGEAAVGTEQYIPHVAMYLLGGSEPVTVTPFANGNFTFTLPTNNGEQYSVVARYPGGDSGEVLLNAPDTTPDQPIRFLSIKDERSGLPYPVPPNANPYTYYNSLSGVGKSGYREWLRQASDPWVDFYIPWEAGAVVEFAFPGQALDPRIDIPLAPTSTHGVSYGDIVYRVNSGVLSGVSAAGSLPPVIQVVATYQNGRTLSYLFDREQIQFKIIPSYWGL